MVSLVSHSAAAADEAPAWHGIGDGCRKAGWEMGRHVDSETSVGAVLVGNDRVSVSVAMFVCDVM